MAGMLQISSNLFLYQDTCNVYIVRNRRDAVLIDFGSGGVLKELESIGVERVIAILMTHHHRDQAQGLPQVTDIPIYVPYSEQDLFHSVDAHWQGRTIYNNYDMRQDRFSLLQSVTIAGTLLDYETYTFGGSTFTVVPTPGHTVGSISILTDVDERRVAFTGDLISAPGKVWSLAATQWTYNGAEGVAASIPSLIDLKNCQPQLLLPSHGEPMFEPASAIDMLVVRLRELLDYRREHTRMNKYLVQPYEPVTEHVLWNRTSMSNAYVVLSESGKALFIDYGYDFMTGLASGSDRSSRRPWLYTLPMLKRDYNVQKIDVVMPTHYHDDHVAGLNLLRRVEDTEVWAANNFADLLEHPAQYDLPCLWYDPIPVDKQLPLCEPIQWEEYTFTLYPLPGHTLYAVAILFEADGKRILAGGDQYQSNDAFNYVYKNRFNMADYVQSAALYRELAPDVILTGHWEPYWVESGYFDNLATRGAALERLHNELLPLDTFDVGAEGTCAWIHPYQAEGCVGQPISFDVEVLSPFADEAEITVDFVAPAGWQVESAQQKAQFMPHEVKKLHFSVTPTASVRRARVAVNIASAKQALGQQAEALVTVAAV
jgi:glyoxylase-like metal-dependent hydrolase (beta-lactamase superfamily II)